MTDNDQTENIVIEFEGNFDLEAVKDKQIRLLGIDTDEPVLKIGNKFYRIEVKDSIGSRLIFDRDEEGKLGYCTKTDKVVTARRVMIKPK